MVTPIALVKLAAMGDVAMACRALRQFSAQYQNAINGQLEIHWIIDQKFKALAQELLNYPTPLPAWISVKWVCVDATKLFQGGFLKKAQAALELLFKIKKTSAEHLLVLHRDKRYQTILKHGVLGKTFLVSPQKMHETKAYLEVFYQLAEAKNFKKADQEKPSNQHLTLSKLENNIGILIGGGKNLKLDYREKRWPFFIELIDLILKQSSMKVVLYGGKEDSETAKLILEKFINEKHRLEDLTGKLTLEQLPNSLSRLNRFITIDSGLAHIASLAMTQETQKIIGLFGPTNPRIWGPLATDQSHVEILSKTLPCSPCYKDDGKFQACLFQGQDFQKCMTMITPDEVFRAVMH